MKKIFLSLLAIAATTLGCNAQLLWEISGNGLQKPSYLFGTHHIAPLAVLDSVKGFNEALTSVDKVYGEMDMAKAQSPQSQQVMLASAMAPQDSTLNLVLSQPQLDSLDVIIKKYMGPMGSAAQFAPMKPSMVSTVLALMVNQKVFPPSNPYPAHAYLSGDLNGMFEIMENSGESSSEAWKERMLNKRNANWMRIMAGIIPTASVLIAVGAGHLPGEKGLINLLRENGFTVKPVE